MIGWVMFPFVHRPQGGVVAISQADAAVISAICVAVPATIAATVAAINAWKAARQMKPNSGHSIRDAVDRIEDSLKDHRTDMAEIKEDVRMIRADQRSDHERITRLENP